MNGWSFKWQLQDIPIATSLSINTKQYKFWSYIFFTIVPLFQLYTSANNCERLGNISGSLFVKAFSALPSHFWSYYKSSVPLMLISFELDTDEVSMVVAPVLPRSSFAKKSLTKTDRCAGALSWRKKTNCCFSIFLEVSFWPHPKVDEVCQSIFFFCSQ